jgi:hypothetical protein
VSDTTLRDLQIRRTVLAHAILALVFGLVIVVGSVGLISRAVPPLSIGQHQRLQPRVTHATSRPRAIGPVTTQQESKTKRNSRGD